MNFPKIANKLFILVLLIFSVLILAACSGDGGTGGSSFSVTDNSVDEWSSVPIFQSDPQGDVGAPDEDVLEIKVANSPASGSVSDMVFMMKLSGTPALQGQYKAVIASIDCDANGIDQEPQDRIIVYVPSEDQYYIMRGDQSEFFSGRDTDGQVVNDYVEWKVALENLPPDEKDAVDCKNIVKIRFGTADVSDYYATKPTEALSVATIIDFTDTLIDWTINP